MIGMHLLARRAALLAATAAVLLAGCERPPVETVQRGYRGTGMELVYNPRLLAEQQALNQAPPATPPAPAEGPKAKDIYQNVQVLGDLSIAQFTRHMAAITQWVSPKEGCNYCHNPANLADDSKYTKIVARKMIQMTQHVNADWKNHVGNTGVTCYTCHRGNPVPSNVWFQVPPQDKRANFIGDQAGQNQASKVVGLTSLPYDPFTPFLDGDKPIRVNGTTALPTGNMASIKQAEHTYALMVHMSTGLGVNCTFCHNSSNFGKWEDSAPQRTTAWWGIRMARDLNNAYLEPLTANFPANRLGPLGDVAKINCATCHQGAYKPLYGAQMAKDFPELLALVKAVAALPAPVAEANRAVMYFDVGSAVLRGEQAKGMAQLIAAMAAQPALKVSISGFHSATGDPAANAELAKQRAFTVRDALLAAGIAEARVALQKPQQVQANAGGEDHDARRVDVVVATR
jgi:photosynthetic reaction center cytochrome c subunit